MLALIRRHAFPTLLKHLSCEVITSGERLKALEEQWDTLFAATPDTTFFQSHACNYSWWMTFGKNHRLFVIVAYEGKRLVGVAPLVIRRRLGGNEIQPIGFNQYAYFGLLVEDSREDVVAILARRLHEACPHGLVHFPYHTVNGGGVNLLGASLASLGWREARWQRNISHGVYTEKGYDGYISEKSRKARYNLKRERKNLEEILAFSVRHYAGAELDEKIIARMSVIQKHSWLWRRGINAIDSPAFSDYILHLAKKDLAQAFLMTCSDKDIAFILNFRSGSNCYCFSIAFDESFKHLSPGKVLMNICVETLLNQGITVYDFLFGDAEFKKFWSNRTKMVFRSTFYRGFRGWLLSWIPHRLHGKLARYDSLRLLLAKIRRLCRGILAARQSCT